ncbi:MAG: DUF1254 domain-containing protein [Hyphomicrobiaceae bacterium]
MMIFGIFLRNWRLLTSALVAAMVLHIATTLTVVGHATTPAFDRLASLVAINRVSVLDQMTPDNQPLPFMMPEVRYAMCRFDASTTPVRVRAHLPGPGWSLSLHTPSGENFLFVPGSSERPTNVELVLETGKNAAERKSISALESARSSPEVRLKAPTGLAVYSAPVKSLALRSQIDRRLDTFSCAPMRAR